MIRKTRLVKVIFGSCAAIFLVLQFLEHPLPSSTAAAGSGSPIQPSTTAAATTIASASTLKTLAISAKNQSQNVSNIKKDLDPSDESKLDKSQDPKSPLSGERIHGLPNETFKASGEVAPFVSDSKIGGILDKIRAINDEQSLRNEDIFGPVSNSTVLIVVQVHNRLPYLRQLIVSLSQAAGIDKTLIIFSHDFWDEEINDLVNSVDFAKTMQIFYPYSIQTHPHEFPGESPNDCPRNAKKDQAKRLNCVNAEWPDLYGHYREAKFTQTKHHWWWKANRIFDQLRVTKSHDGLVLFLEEDHYVSEDFLSVLSLVDAERMARHPNCDIICLGTYLKSYNYNRDHKTVDILPWESAKHNMGMAFKRSLWEKIHACREYFCNYDDYNWDWSLQHLSKQCFKQKLEVLLVKAPRVFHIGECGVHHKKKQCESSKVVKKVRDILEKAKSFLFPSELKVTKVTPKRSKNQKNPKGNGGWGDHRDRALCLNMASNSATQPQLSSKKHHRAAENPTQVDQVINDLKPSKS